MAEFFRRLKANVRDCCCCVSTSVSFRFLLPVGVAISLCCLLVFVLTYLIFQSTSQLPAISQTGIDVPGRYLLTGVLIIIGFLFCLMSPILGIVQKRNVIRANAGRDNPLKCCFCLNLLCVHHVSCIGLLLAGIGLATLGLFPVQELGTDVKFWGYAVTAFHLGGAIVFFASYYVHMVLQTCLVFRYNSKRKCCNWFKLVLVILATVFWLVAPILYMLILLWSCNINDLAQDMAEHPRSHDTTCTAYNLMQTAFAALDQYALILTVVAFVASYWLEFSNVSVSLDLGDRSIRFGDEPTVETENQDGRGFLPLSDDEMDEDELFDDKPKEIVDEDAQAGAQADGEASGGEGVELEDAAASEDA